MVTSTTMPTDSCASQIDDVIMSSWQVVNLAPTLKARRGALTSCSWQRLPDRAGQNQNLKKME